MEPAGSVCPYPVKSGWTGVIHGLINSHRTLFSMWHDLRLSRTKLEQLVQLFAAAIVQGESRQSGKGTYLVFHVF